RRPRPAHAACRLPGAADGARLRARADVRAIAAAVADHPGEQRRRHPRTTDRQQHLRGDADDRAYRAVAPVRRLAREAGRKTADAPGVEVMAKVRAATSAATSARTSSATWVAAADIG